MSHQIIETMRKYLEECFYNVENGNKKGVIQVLNDMKNYYMVENDMKIGLKKQPENQPNKELMKLLKDVKKNSDDIQQKQNVNAIGKEIIDDQPPVSNKPIRHIIY